MTPTLTPARPNLFNLATSELSQDAFLAWLLSWSSDACLDAVETENLQTLKKASHAFLGLLTGQGERAGKVTEVLLQWNKIDLLIHGVEQDGGKFSLVIEDKTGTGGHDNQLERYREIVEEEGHGRPYFVYLKTGWWSPDDEHGLCGYTPLKRGDVLDCLEPFSGCHSILDDYLVHLKNIDAEIASAVEGALVTGDVAKAFTSHAGLKAFLDAAFPQPSEDEETWSSFGVGIGGQPWANWSFAWEEMPGTDKDEGFFWRVDTRAGEAILSLRKYWDHEGDAIRKVLAAHRFQVYLKVVEATLHDLGTCFVSSKLAARRSSYKEQELLLFALGDSSDADNLNDPCELATAIRSEINERLQQALLAARKSMES